MLAHRLRRWPNIKTILAQRLVFAGIFFYHQGYLLSHRYPLSPVCYHCYLIVTHSSTTCLLLRLWIMTTRNLPTWGHIIVTQRKTFFVLALTTNCTLSKSTALSRHSMSSGTPGTHCCLNILFSHVFDVGPTLSKRVIYIWRLKRRICCLVCYPLCVL